MAPILVGILLLLGSGAIRGAPDTPWAKGADFCGTTDSTDVTRTYFGPCASTAGPDHYVQQNIDDLIGVEGVVDATTAEYLTNPSTNPTIEADVTKTGAGTGSTSSTNPFTNPSWPAGTSYERVDNYFPWGDTSENVGTHGGYVSVAAYICTAGLITYRDNHFVYNANGDTVAACVTPLQGGNCVTEYTAQPGTIKLSFFARSIGPGHSAAFASFSHVGFRTRLTIPPGYSFYFNGDPEATSFGSDDISSISFLPGSTDGTAMHLSFRTAYNAGPFAISNGEVTASATNTIHIKASAGSSADEMRLDYLFDQLDFSDKDRYIVYDPEFSSGAVDSSSSSLSTGAIAGIAVGAGVVILAVIVAVIMKKGKSVSG